MQTSHASAAQIRTVGSSAGFTLLEVVIATAILAVGVAVAMQVFSGGLSNLHHIQMSHRAMSHAENLMSEILADQDIRGPYHASGGLDEDFFYEAQVNYWEDPNASSLIMDSVLPAGVLPQVYLLSVSVKIGFKNPKNNLEREYRAWCLKTVTEDQEGVGEGEINPSQRLQEILRGRR